MEKCFKKLLLLVFTLSLLINGMFYKSVFADDFSKFEEQLKDYDDTVSNLIPGLKQDLQDAIDEEIEINIKDGKIINKTKNGITNKNNNINMHKIVFDDLIKCNLYA